MKKSRRFIASLALSLLIGSTSILKPVAACGPFTAEAILSYTDNPDLPLKKFLDGELGVLRPGWYKSYLVVAYRTLSNKPFTTPQRDAVYKLWRARIQDNAFTNDADSGSQNESKTKKASSLDLWMKERGAVPDTKPVKIEQERSIPDKYDSFINCPDNGFDAATDNLKRKISKHGVTSPFVKDWVAAQDLVFCHCAAPGDPNAMFDAKKNPPPPEPPFPAQVTDAKDTEASQDRAYQHAAALFYAEQYDKALKEFSDISSEVNSPYAKTSRYMMPRCLIRKATMTNLSSESLKSTYAEAEKLLRVIIADSGMVEFKQSSEDLLGFVLFRSEPANRLNELSAQIVSTDKSVTSAQYYRSLDDYTRLLDSLEGAPTDPYESKHGMNKIPALSKDDDLSNWIVTWERNDSSCFSNAVARWHQTHSPAWLLAALHVAPADKQKTDELLQAARSIQPDSPAYLSANYESARLHLRRGETADAIKAAEDFKSIALKKQLLSAANLFMDVRGKAPINTAQFVENSVRIPAYFAFSNEYLDEQFSPNFNKGKKRADFVFGAINAAYMNERVPLTVMVEMSTSDKLPVKLRADAEQAAWVRAVVLNDYSSQNKLLPALQRDYPKLASLFKTTATGSEADRKFAAACLILKTPGMRPYVTGGTPREEQFDKLDTFSDNWWYDSPPDQDTTSEVVKSKATESDYPNLLTPAQSKQGLNDKKQLLSAGAGPTFLCTVVADYATTHKSDPRVAEALHLAVRSSHYGLKEKRTTPVSKKCFTLLHTNYPKSRYAVDTPYYY